MSGSYNYSIANDTLNGAVDLPNLTDSIRSSDILIALNSITTNEDTLSIIFKTSLSLDDQNELNDIVSVHDGVSDEEEILKFAETLPQGGPRVTDRGFNFTATAGQTTAYDFQLVEDFYVKGGRAICKGFEFGDTVSMHIVHPLTDAILHSYIKSFPVAPLDGDVGEVNASNSAITETNFKGLKIRMEYTSTGSTDVKIGVGIRGYS